MARRKDSANPAGAIEAALRLGDFIAYKQSWGFVSGLEEAKGLLDRMLAGGEANPACELYELFLAGCHEKAEEVDDSGGNLGMFFKDLFCGWIKARQAAGRDPSETVRDILGWMDRDDYGFCFDEDAGLAASRSTRSPGRTRCCPCRTSPPATPGYEAISGPHRRGTPFGRRNT